MIFSANDSNSACFAQAAAPRCALWLACGSRVTASATFAPAAQAAQATQAAEAAQAAQAAQALQAAQAAQGPKLTKRRRSGVIPAPQYRNSGKVEEMGKS